jgi:hypothetical protein
MTRIFTCLALMASLGCPVLAQSAAPKSKKTKMASPAKRTQLQDPVKNGTELSARSVGANVRVQAVLIPRDDVNQIFGKEIGKNYAVIQLIVGNKSPDAALIIHGVFIDYSQWALSGALLGGASPTVTGDQFQAVSKPNQIASEEYRVVRGQLLNAKNWTWRNVTIRALTLIGGLAGATTFSFNNRETQLIAAFNGTLIPGVETLWPDDTIGQLNRVSDFGYQANKVIPQNGSEVIVCFFPIDRFLTPGFKELFLTSPALFFSPLEMLVDETIKAKVEKVLGDDFGTGIDVKILRKNLPCFLKAKQYLSRIADEVRKREEAARRKADEASTADTSATNKEQEAGTKDEPKKEQYVEAGEIPSDPLGEACLSAFGLRNENGKIVASGAAPDGFKIFLVLDYLRQMSLNYVTVVVDGVMTVDTGTLVAKIDGVGFDDVSACGDPHKPCFWIDTDADDGVRKGTIDGSYLTGGTVKITEAETLKIEEVSTVSEGSGDQKLHFSFKLTQPLDNQTKLHFIVSKPVPGTADDSKNAKTKDSLPWEYVVDYGAATAPATTNAQFDASAKTLTVTGTGFVDAPPKNPLVVTLHPPEGEDIDVDSESITISSTKLVIPMENTTAGCWSVDVSVGTNPSLERKKNRFMIAPSPTLTSAVKNVKTKPGKPDKQSTRIVVTGENLIEISDCSGKKMRLKFQLVQVPDADGQAAIDLIPIGDQSETRWAFKVPAKAREAGTKWQVKLLLNGKAASSTDLK